MFARIIMSLCLVLVAVPALAFSQSSIDELRAQIQAYEEKLSSLRAQLAVYETALATTSVATTSRPFINVPICVGSARNARQGERGDHVTALQTFLKEQGFLKDAPTGFFGAMTKDALQNWQRKEGLIKQDERGGIFGDQSRNFIRERICGPFFKSLSPASTTLATSTPPRPQFCTEEYAPVCSKIDGTQKSYTNQCRSKMAGAEVMYGGLCKGTDTPIVDPKPPVTEVPTTPISGSCKVWTDGCNTCTRATPGAPGACTLMACVNLDGSFKPPVYTCTSTF